MADFNWIGGTAKTTHVMTATVDQTWSSSGPDVIRTEIIDEGGTTRFVQTNVTSGTVSTGVIDPHLVDLQADTQRVFAAITWTKGSTSTIVATAKEAGVPLSSGVQTNVIIDNSTTAGDGRVVWATTTANTGPNDGNTDANWTDQNDAATTSPLSGTTNTVRFLPHPTDVDLGGNPVSYDLRYGLIHSGININRYRHGRSYRGIVGDPTQGFFFQIDCTNNTGKTIIDSNSPSIWLKGSHSAINIAGLPLGEDALHLGGGTITDLRMLGSRVLGKITIASSTVVVTIESLGANMEVDIGTETGTLISQMTVDGGTWTIRRAITGGSGILDLLGGTITHTVGNVTLVKNYGGLIYFNSTGIIATLKNFKGTSNFERNTTHGIEVQAATIWSGQILDKSGLANVNWSGNIIVFGGSVTSDTAATQSQTA